MNWTCTTTIIKRRPANWRLGRRMNRQLEKFLSAFASLLDISPRPHKPIQPPLLERGIGRHFEAALGHIGAAMQYVEKARINADNKQAHNGTRYNKTA